MTAPPTLPPTDDERLLDYLRDRDVFCPLCKYNLRNLTVPRCPECGRGVRLGVGLTEPFLAAWITGMVGLAGGAGVGVLFLTGVVVEYLRYGEIPFRHMPLSEAVAACCFVASMAGAGLWVTRRRRILRLEPRHQWRLAVLADVAVAGAFVLLCLSE